MKLIYQNRTTGEKVQLYKLTPSMWYRIENDRRVFMKQKDLKEWKFLKNESVTGGWKDQRFAVKARA